MKVFVGQVLPYITVAILLGGITWRIWRWMIGQIVHNITLPPFPSSWPAAIVWILWQIVSFWNIFKFDRGLWVFAWPMHVALASIAGGHFLGIYTLGQQFHLLLPWIVTPHQSEAASNFLGTTFGILFFLMLLGLLYRRLAIEKVRVISAPSDYLHLLLLLGIVGVGDYMRLVHTASLHYAEAREYLAGLFTFNPQPLPDNGFFFIHFLLVQIMLIIFPFSKLMHPFGILWNRWIYNRPFQQPPVGLPGAKIKL
ncbi:respiratory nitrate reductase subunit gamma [Thermodesulfitimonas autotrophica]|uniref:Nitrate reductase gamma subunit n=1 Tax=Thermodesulfitimonas autotrophica TaxID=1894989 RepID=A0A3N5AQP4_9THEO|nr:respiratory nitrate reductase subunit gamma [Thermodesulfitimonas autotrophica]RPF47203.1 nitrate reductase gamma subunit [Thermodesulfitimonas autotrophica]